jgi:phage terminase Nu1 subunit (DNA packaging protein)
LTFIPPWMDITTLAKHICASPSTVENWSRQGILPAPRKRGGKLMWRWAEVDAWLLDGKPGGSPDQEAEDVRESTRRALTETRN